MAKLKDTDKQMLNLLQRSDLCVPRVTRLAHLLKLPTSTVHERLKTLQKEGYVKGYSVELDPEKLEKGFVVFFLGQMKMGKGLAFEKAAEELLKIPQVQEIYFIAGEWDYLVKIRVKDKEEYYEVAKEVSKCFEVRGMGIVTTKCFKDSPKFQVE
jgi:Lrp/AsnC family leucine-responsive transcriptional regulator